MLMPRIRSLRLCRALLHLEELERRDLLAGFAPTVQDQLFLEQLNDARANPPAYGASIGLDLSNVAPVQPLAFNPQLIQAATLDAQDMNNRGFFDHINPDGLGPSERVAATGFGAQQVGEAIAGGAIGTTANTLAGFIIDYGNPNGGHRHLLLAIDNPTKAQNQVGIGVLQNGTGPLHDYTVVDTALGNDPRPFITGVVYNDGNGNGLYDAGEGLADVTITVSGVGSFIDWDTGGYSIQVNPGTYTVTASGGRLAAPITTTVTVGQTNYRLNFIGQDTQTWTSLASLPAPRTYLAAAAGPDGRIYAVGGRDSAGNNLDTLTAYDPATNAWTTLAPMPTPRNGLAAVFDNGLLYALGGGSTVEVYHPTTNTWTTAASMPAPLAVMAATVGSDGRIYVFGGTDSSDNATATAEVYDPGTNSWASLPSMPVARDHPSAATGADGRIYVLGGGPSFFQPSTEVDVFTPGSSTWTQAAALPSDSDPSVAVTGADGQIYAIGGVDLYSAQEPENNLVYAYSSALNSWATVANLPTARSNEAATLGTDGRIYVIGGENDSNTGTLHGTLGVVEALPTSHALDPISSVTLLSYSGPPLPAGTMPGTSTTHVMNGTGLVDVQLGPMSFDKHKHRWWQTVVLHNKGDGALRGPLSLVLDKLPAGVKLLHQTGVTRKQKPLKSPYVTVPLGSLDVLDPGQSVTITLMFSGKGRPHYKARILVGSGAR
jgi:N-acetylneuraminic acid mutarotase